MDCTSQPKNQHHGTTTLAAPWAQAPAEALWALQPSSRSQAPWALQPSSRGDIGLAQSAKESNRSAGAETRLWFNRPAGAQGPLPSGIQPQDPTAPPEPWAPPQPRRRPGVKDNQRARLVHSGRPPPGRQCLNKHQGDLA